jgi:hypothetical protein
VAGVEDLQTLVDQADPDELLIAVDRLSAARAWDDLVELARRCRGAIEVGRQLWAVATHIDYRLALEAPARYAAGVLRPGAGRFALGPLTEVAASTHDWGSLAPHLRDPVTTQAVAQERVLRGEDLRRDERARSALGERLPLRLADWEPRYALPVYRDRSAEFPQTEVATRHAGPARPLEAGQRLADDDAARALRAAVEPWVAESAGQARTAVVAGTAPNAVGCLVPDASLLPITAGEAFALLQWAGASGGAHGRRRGGAAGRFAAWWTAAAVAGLDWPVEEDELGRAIHDLRWCRWKPPGPETGWVLRLAAEDRLDGLAWALEATDRLSGPSTAEDASAGTR